MVYGKGADLSEPKKSSTFSVKVGLAQMLRAGVIMDVVTPEHPRIAEEAGACAVMALERVPVDIRAQGGVARMSDPGLIKEIKRAVTIPVMAKARIGHFVEAQNLEAVGGPPPHPRGRCHDPHQGRGRHRQHHRGRPPRPFRHGRHPRPPQHGRRRGLHLRQAHRRSVRPCHADQAARQASRRPFCCWRGCQPADAALMMQLGCDGVFVGSGIFKSGDPARRARAIVQAVTHYSDPEILAEVSCGLGEAMAGINLNDTRVQRFANRSE
ncbi:hypothetical protein BHM03_00041487 [Ensete ventricosum]|nr:hypothetical protein BHM03_00041487 [Ensete ventricosum]